ncbi:MAG: thiamine phosphate synthase [Gammaproteobacteria bacterium]|nr:thiamine phosphate synthase [Gammaproteobacteria bacterium]NND61254.1 thiamine phosphate synthase [Gammaproteobacteria bacterium]
MSRELKRGLYVVTGGEYVESGRLANAVQHAILGGARIVQYRDKGRNRAQRKHEAAALRDICHSHDVLFIINDDIRLADEVGADGVHLGRDDATIEHARHLLGDDALIGVSCYNLLGMARRAVEAGANYVAFGSFFHSQTKPGASRAEASILTEARDTLDTHIVAIGGITPDNGERLIRAGADMLAVCGGVFDHRDPESAARHFARLFRDTR